jgi:hypothetical protein
MGSRAQSRIYSVSLNDTTSTTNYLHTTRFGVPAMLLEMIPFVGIFFSFTNTVGAALWAADLEKQSANPTKPTPPAASSANSATPSDQPPSYDELEF